MNIPQLSHFGILHNPLGSSPFSNQTAAVENFFLSIIRMAYLFAPKVRQVKRRKPLKQAISHVIAFHLCCIFIEVRGTRNIQLSNYSCLIILLHKRRLTQEITVNQSSYVTSEHIPILSYED